MTILALRTSRQANGVSKLHGEVSKGLWKDVWAGVPDDEVPITSITNGIHTKTWAAPEFMDLYTQYLGADWEENLTNVDYWLRVNRIPDEVLWDTHQKLKARLIEFARSAGPHGSASGWASRPRTCVRSTTSSTRKSSPSGSRAGSPPTSAARCCSASPSAC